LVCSAAAGDLLGASDLFLPPPAAGWAWASGAKDDDDEVAHWWAAGGDNGVPAVGPFRARTALVLERTELLELRQEDLFRVVRVQVLTRHLCLGLIHANPHCHYSGNFLVFAP
jgi:hypothetical protein